MGQSTPRTLAIGLLALLPLVPAKAQNARNIESEVSGLDALRFRAMSEADIPALERMLSGDLVYTHASGWRQTKSEFLVSLRSGELVYHSIASTSAKAKVYSSTILVTGRASARVKSKGQELNVELLYLEAYVEQNGRWQLAAWQSTRVPPATSRSR